MIFFVATDFVRRHIDNFFHLWMCDSNRCTVPRPMHQQQHSPNAERQPLQCTAGHLYSELQPSGGTVEFKRAKWREPNANASARRQQCAKESQQHRTAEPRRQLHIHTNNKQTSTALRSTEVTFHCVRSIRR